MGNRPLLNANIDNANLRRRSLTNQIENVDDFQNDDLQGRKKLVNRLQLIFDEEEPPKLENLSSNVPNKSWKSDFQSYKVSQPAAKFATNFPPSDEAMFNALQRKFTMSGVDMRTTHSKGDAFGQSVSNKAPSAIWHMKQPAEYARTNGIKISQDGRKQFSNSGLIDKKGTFKVSDRPIFEKNNEHFTMYKNKLKKYNVNQQSWEDAKVGDAIEPGDITDVTNWDSKNLRQSVDNGLAYGDEAGNFDLSHNDGTQFDKEQEFDGAEDDVEFEE